MPSILGLQRSRVLRRLVQGSAALLLSAAPAVAQSQLWVDQIGGIRSDSAQATATDGQGGVFVTGYLGQSDSPSYSAERDLLLARYDASGKRLWAHRLGTEGPGSVQANGMASDTFGGVYVVGLAEGDFGGFGASFKGFWLARFNAAGEQLWIHTLPSNVSFFRPT